MRQKPTVLAREIVASSRLFRVEELQLRFSNGVERTYERLVSRGSGYGAVMIVAMADARSVLLVEEYCGGTDSYELSLPKGLIEPGEDVLEAANRELKEEAGFGARQLEFLAELSLSPGYMSQKIQVVLARDLYVEHLPATSRSRCVSSASTWPSCRASCSTRSSARGGRWPRCTWRAIY